MPVTADSPEPVPQPVGVPLRRPPLWYPGLTVLLVIALFFGFSAAVDAVPRMWHGTSLPVDTLLSLLAAGGWLILLTLVWLKRWITRCWPAEPILLYPTYLRLPRSPELWRYRNVAYDAIVAIHEGGRPQHRQFLIESRQHTFYLPEMLFAQARGPEALLAALQSHILALPQGASLLERTERQRHAARLTLNVRPLATQAIFGVAAIFFANAWLKGGLDAPFGLLRWGANAPALVFSGEYYRLLAANFLHSHWAHAAVNGLALYYLGSLLERVLGWARFVLVYGFAGVTAMLASAFLSGAIMSVGASGAIFGLLAGFGVISWRLRTQLPLEFRQTPRWWVAMLATNALVPLYFPSIDIVAHLAGFAAGGLLTLALLGRRQHIPPAPKRGLLALGGLTVGLYVAALGTAVWRAAAAGPQDQMVFAQMLVDNKTTSATTLNALAWLWVVDPRSDDEQLAMAERSAMAAIERAPSEAGWYATLAMVHERRHATDATIIAWRTALERTKSSPTFGAPTSSGAKNLLVKTSSPQKGTTQGTTVALENRLDASLYAVHLAQSLLARPANAPPLSRDWPAAAMQPPTLSLESGLWTLQALGPLPKDAVVYAILYTDATPVALIQVTVAAHTMPPWRATGTMTEEMGGASRGQVVLLASRPAFVEALAEGQASAWAAWPLPEMLQHNSF